MASKIIWFRYAVDKVMRSKLGLKTKYSKQKMLGTNEASSLIKEKLSNGEPFMAGRFGFFELAVMRMYEFHKKNKYAKVMDNLYNCAGFFPNDTELGYKFTELMDDSLTQCDLLACSRELCENYFMNRYQPKNGFATNTFSVFNICELEESWTTALKGKKVLVVLPFEDSVQKQYSKRDKLFVDKTNPESKDNDPDSDGYRLPEFQLKTYKSLLTVGDLRDDRFTNWFEALDYMTEDILKMDFDVALLGCGAYGFPLAARIKKSGRTAIHMGGTTQLVFGIMGRRWDGSRFGGIDKMDPKVARFYNEHWTYPIEGKPEEASKVEYGPYWK